jgi:calcineurin-like phosphoesterase family protein
MSRIKITADPHFHHPFLAKKRGFTKLDDRNLVGTPDGKPDLIGDMEAHDGTILENLNKGARKDDILIIAGDFAMNWKGVDRILAQLTGRVILVNGNHDITSPVFRNGWAQQKNWTGEGKFEAIVDVMPRKVGDREYLISHYPYEGDHPSRDRPEGEDRMTQYRLRDEGMWLVHGHTHSDQKTTPFTLIPGDWDEDGRGEPLIRGKQIHVGLDAWDLKPVFEDDVIDMMKALDSQGQ